MTIIVPACRVALYSSAAAPHVHAAAGLQFWEVSPHVSMKSYRRVTKSSNIVSALLRYANIGCLRSFDGFGLGTRGRRKATKPRLRSFGDGCQLLSRVMLRSTSQYVFREVVLAGWLL